MKDKKTNQAIVLVASIILSLGVGFYTGTKYKPNNKQDFVNQFNQRNRDQMGGSRQPGLSGQRGSGMPGGFRPVAGEIIASDGKTITVKLTDGSSKLVLVTGNTTISKAQSADINNLLVGEKVSVFGNQNPDGSTTAQNIQLNPLMPNASPSASPAK